MSLAYLGWSIENSYKKFKYHNIFFIAILCEEKYQVWRGPKCDKIYVLSKGGFWSEYGLMSHQLAWIILLSQAHGASDFPSHEIPNHRKTTSALRQLTKENKNRNNCIVKSTNEKVCILLQFFFTFHNESKL